jgi:hypothetical protein
MFHRKRKRGGRKEDKVGGQAYICIYIHADLSMGAVVAYLNNATLISVYWIKF